MAERAVVTDEEVAHILLSWEKVVQEGDDADVLELPPPEVNPDMLQASEASIDSTVLPDDSRTLSVGEAITPESLQPDSLMLSVTRSESATDVTSSDAPASEAALAAYLASLSDSKITLTTTRVRVTQAEALVLEIVGTTLEVALGYIPFIGPILGAAFNFLWGRISPISATPVTNPLLDYHDQIIGLIQNEINLNNVQLQLTQGRTALHGIEAIAQQYRNAYMTWQNNPRDIRRMEVLRIEFIGLKNVLIQITPLYWDSTGLPLLHMGCTTSALLIAILRDVVASGRSWGFSGANIQNFQATLTSHVAYVVTRCRTTRLPSPNMTYRPARNFVYMDPTVAFLGRRRVNFLTSSRHTFATLDPNFAYVITASAMANQVQTAVRISNSGSYAGISTGGAELMSQSAEPEQWWSSSPSASGRLSFSREGRFIVRLGRPMWMSDNATFTINGRQFTRRNLVDQNSQFPRFPGDFRTAVINLTCFAPRENGSFQFADFIITPV